MVFAREGTAVVEIVSRHPSHRMFMHLAYMLRLPYWVVAADVPPNIFEKTFSAPPDELRLAVARALQERQQARENTRG